MRNIIMSLLSICGVILWCIAVLALLTVNVTVIIWMVYIGVMCLCGVCNCYGYGEDGEVGVETGNGKQGGMKRWDENGNGKVDF